MNPPTAPQPKPSTESCIPVRPKTRNCIAVFSGCLHAVPASQLNPLKGDNKKDPGAFVLKPVTLPK
jgi:hypothetical protein